MVICKFFQQGNCRYGSNCNYEHVYGSKYNYQAPARTTQQSQNSATDEQLINVIQADMQSALYSGQWILSSYAPYKEQPGFPGFSDLSPEEARLFIYEAKANNNYEQAVTYMNNLISEMKKKHEQLLQPTAAILKVCRSLWNGEIPPSPFSNKQSSSANATSLFRSAVQNTQNTFGSSSTSSVFSQTNQNAFGSQNSNAKSVFAQANKSVFGSNQSSNAFGGTSTNSGFFGPPKSDGVFGGPKSDAAVFGDPKPNNAAKSIFAQASQSVFGSQPPASSNPSNIFANANKAILDNKPVFGNHQSNVFDKPQQYSSFGAKKNVFEQKTEADSDIYSKMEDLTEFDLQQFNSDSFKLGFIPEVPPPQSLCL